MSSYFDVSFSTEVIEADDNVEELNMVNEEITLKFSYGSVVVQLWFSYSSVMVQLWFSYGYVMVMLW